MSDAETPSQDRPWDDISYIRRHKGRSATMGQLHDYGPSMPSTIADHADLSIATVSASLAALRDRGYVELLVPEDTRKGRIYGLTADGERLAEQVTEVAR